MKVLTLTHATLMDAQKNPTKVQIIFGPGIVYWQMLNETKTLITVHGGTLTVLETVEEINQMLTKE